MAQSKIDGINQILAGSIPLSALVSGYSIPTGNLADGANFLKKDGSVTMTGALNLGGTTPTGGATPTNASDLTTKSYVDSKINGLVIHPVVRAVAVANVGTLSGLQTIDGVALIANDRVFLTAQTTASQNGPWVVASGAWTRPLDWAAGSTQPEGAYWISDPDGTTYKNTKWFTNNTAAITVDTTSVTFTQDSSGTSYSAGNGISLTGTVFAVKTGNGITFDGSNNVIAVANATKGMEVGASGIGIVDGTPGQVGVFNSSNHFAPTTISGDVTITSAGVTTVNNTAGSGFVKYGNFVFNETPSGTINSSNTAFTLAFTPQSSSVQLFYNGVLMEVGAGNDYTISGTAITMLFAPVTGDKLRANYVK